jgi:hypothetical protein
MLLLVQKCVHEHRLAVQSQQPPAPEASTDEAVFDFHAEQGGFGGIAPPPARHEPDLGSSLVGQLSERGLGYRHSTCCLSLEAFANRPGLANMGRKQQRDQKSHGISEVLYLSMT